MKRYWNVALVLAVIGLLAFTLLVSADSGNVLKNGSVEDEFVYGVGKYWSTFSNGGHVSYGYHDDTWDKVVYDGEHSELLEIHTKAVGGSDRDRYFGILQTADVVPGSRYMFSFYGLVRSTEGSELRSRWNYRVQVGFDYAGGSDPDAVTEWVQMDWPETYRLSPGSFQSYAHGVTATSDKLTVFIRVWKKFPTVGEEANINIDAVSLVGPTPGTETPPMLPKTGAGYLFSIAGLGLAGIAITLTGMRLRRRGLVPCTHGPLPGTDGLE